MNDKSEGQNIDEGNEVEQDASGSASVNTYSRQTTQSEKYVVHGKLWGAFLDLLKVKMTTLVTMKQLPY